MKAWFSQLNEREQQLVVVGGILGVCVIVFVLYSDYVSPFFKNSRTGSQQLQQMQADLDWLRQAAMQAKQLKPQSSLKSNRGNQSLFALVDSSSKQAQLSQAVKRVEPEGEKRVRIWLENAKFDDAINWLSLLHSRYQINVEKITIDAVAPGQVNLSALLIETNS